MSILLETYQPRVTEDFMFIAVTEGIPVQNKKPNKQKIKQCIYTTTNHAPYIYLKLL